MRLREFLAERLIAALECLSDSLPEPLALKILIRALSAHLPEPLIPAVLDGIESAMLRERLNLKLRDRFGSEWQHRAGKPSTIDEE